MQSVSTADRKRPRRIGSNLGLFVSALWLTVLGLCAILVHFGVIKPDHGYHDRLQPPSLFPFNLLDRRVAYHEPDRSALPGLMGSSAGTESRSEAPNEPEAGKQYVLGTDDYGHPILDRLLMGLPRYLFYGGMAAFLTLVVGTGLGSIIGYTEGLGKSLARWFCDTIATFPRIVLLVLVIAMWNSNLEVVLITAAVLSIPRVAGIVSSRIEELKALQFVEAAREMGLSHGRILFVHLLWRNMKGPVLTQMTYVLAEVLLLESTMAYLNFGEPESSWGFLVAVGRDNIRGGAYWVFAVPALAIATTIATFQWLGDGLTDRFRLKRLVT